MNLLKDFKRLLLKQKSVSGMAIGSLSVGIAVALLIGMWVYTEFRFDSFHEKGEGIYRVFVTGRDRDPASNTFRQLGDNMKQGFPEVQEVCRITGEDVELRIDNKLVPEKKILQADDNFFTFFSFSLVEGNREACLNAPDNMVVSSKTAGEWFGNEDPVGKMVLLNGKNYRISAVMKDIPYHSHIQADIVVPFYGRFREGMGMGDAFITYLYAPALHDLKALEDKLTKLADETAYHIMSSLGLQCRLEALKDIHFGQVGSDHDGKKSLVMILVITALAILLIACINFVNLFIATSFLRIKEIGVKKTYGASRKQLMYGVFQETSLLVVVSEGLALLLVVLFLPLFNQLAECDLVLDFTSPVLYFFLIAVYLFTLVVAGSYPAFYTTRFNVLQTLSGRFTGKKLSYLQGGLLVFQFTVSIAFLILIFFIQKQVNYMVSYDLGFDKEHVVCMDALPALQGHYETIRSELLMEPGIIDLTIKDGLPTYWADGYPVLKPGSTTDRVVFEVCQVGQNYLELMQIKLTEGKNPFHDQQARNEIIIDENAVKQLELKEPVGTILEFWGHHFIVKGVARNIQSKGLWNGKAAPVVYMPFNSNEYGKCVIMCKVAGNPQAGIKALQKQWETYVTELPFSYYFLDETYEKLYVSEARLKDIFLWAMGIMVLLSVSGLFAIAYYIMQHRLKEIGIRKVNGATLKDLLLLLNTVFVRLVVVACVVASVIAYCFMDYWLEQFAVRTTLDWWVYMVSGCLGIAITVLTVFYLTIRAARLNPVEVLKSE